VGRLDSASPKRGWKASKRPSEVDAGGVFTDQMS
jgi:hypothetical protein